VATFLAGRVNKLHLAPCTRARSERGSHRDHPQQSRLSCIGGHGTSPHEQNTQQSPRLGLSSASQAGHSQKNWQASVGMRTRVAEPHFGHVIVLSSCKVGAAISDAPCAQDAWS
jgi:hypothetical protein